MEGKRPKHLQPWGASAASQRSLHNEPIFRLLLKVAVKGTQQCEFLNFCGAFAPTMTHALALRRGCISFPFAVHGPSAGIMQLFQRGASYLCYQAPSTARVAALRGAPHSVRGRRTRQHAGEAFLNLPGWCWARIKQLALIGSSSSLHSEACKALGGSDGVVHSTISLAAICMRTVAKIKKENQKKERKN